MRGLPFSATESDIIEVVMVVGIMMTMMMRMMMMMMRFHWSLV